MPVSAFVSSAEANESLATPISRRTTWFTSSRRVAFTTQAAYCLGSFFDATMIVFAECSRGTPYFSDRKSTRLNSSHLVISYAVFCLKKKKKNNMTLDNYVSHIPPSDHQCGAVHHTD